MGKKREMFAGAALAAFVLLAGCGVAEPVQSELESAEGAESSTPEKEYAALVSQRIEQYGIAESDAMDSVGFLCGSLVDFDRDGVAELVCEYRTEESPYRAVQIYTYCDNTPQLLLDTYVGNGFGCTDVSEGKCGLYAVDGNAYYLIEDSDEFHSVCYHIYSVAQNTLKETTLSANARRLEKEEIATVPEEYQISFWEDTGTWFDCEIDGQAVSLEDFAAALARNTEQTAVVGSDGVICSGKNDFLQMLGL